MKALIAVLGLVTGLMVMQWAQADAIAGAGSSSGAQAGSSSGAQAGVTLNSNSVQRGTDFPASSPAAIMIQSCMEAASATSMSRALSFGTDSAQCAAIRQAAVHMELHDRYAAMGMKDSAVREWDKAMKFVITADEAANVGHYPKVIGGTVTSLLPVAVLFVLF